MIDPPDLSDGFKKLSPLPNKSTFDTALVAACILHRHFFHDDNVRVWFESERGIRPRPIDVLIDSSTSLANVMERVETALEVHGSSNHQSVGRSESDWCVSLPSDADEGGICWGSCDHACEPTTIAAGRCNHQADFDLWASCWLVLVDSIANADNDVAAMSLNYVSDDVRQAVIDRGHTPAPQHLKCFSREPTVEFTLPYRFQEVVAEFPNRVAVIAAHQTETHQSPFRQPAQELTYQQLNQRANQIAWQLIDMQIPAGSSVGVYLNRSPVMLAVLVGIMKAGCSYVPLSTEVPRDRLSYMTTDAALRCVVSEDNLLEVTRDFVAHAKNDSLILNIDDQAFNARTSDSRNEQGPDSKAVSTDLAYTIYTSGSAGMPKGVPVSHHALLNFCNATHQMLGFTEQDASLAITTIAFDVSIVEIFPMLTIGGKVGMASEKVGADGKLLAKAIELTGATYTAVTPTSLRILVASGWDSSPNLTVITGGEAISRELCNDIVPRCKRLINGYGPTESTVYTTYGHLEIGEGSVPIGRPVLNVRTYILDAFGNPVPPNVHGQLFIGGESLAKGYLNRPELTAEKFVADPFSSIEAARMYATGDVCFYDHDGLIFYLGRQDHQVKIRGYRIELGEIESRLKDHDAVKDAVVIAREDHPGDKRLVAYIIPEIEIPDDRDLQNHLAETMPEYMVPAWIVPMEEFTQNSNGKLDRKALPKPEDVLVEEDDVTPESDSGQLAKDIARIWTSVLKRRIRVDDEVFRMGADSLRAVGFQLELEQSLGVKIPVGEIFQYRTPELLAERIANRTVRFTRSKRDRRQSHGIAIVGMAGRFPGANNLDQFWQNLEAGVESIRDFTEAELKAAGVSPLEFRKDSYIKRGTTLDGAYDFEPEFFGVTHAEAELVSPQIRLFMQTAFEAMEHGGYPEQPAGQRIGVFAGAGYPNYLNATFGMPESERLQVLVGNGPDYIATRTSFSLGLTGPAVSIQTACSTSLVAVAEACQAIRSGRCEMAIAGGASFSWPHGKGYHHGPGLIYSNDGHCRAFDHRASGTIFSQGVGAVLLKPVEDAIADGDTIHAVIHGVATNNDGARKGGFASPSIEGQAEVIQAALADSGLSPEDISYVEAHGTGTKIGDPIEISGLTSAWSAHTDRTGFCGIGSVKTNIGHTDSAAGIAGLLKVVLSLKHSKIPPTLNYDSANPEIDFANTPFVVQDKLADWISPEAGKRVAAISAFGLGGTNAHAILGEAPAVSDPESKNDSKDNGETLKTQRPKVIPVSARTEHSLQSSIVRLQEAGKDLAADQFEDFVFTLRNGRKQLKKRAFTISASSAVGEFKKSLATCVRRDPVFMFTGQGSQYARMAFESYRHEPVFRNVIEKCDRLMRGTSSGGLIEWLYADPNDASQSTIDITDTRFAQPAIFATGLAQAHLWMSWGIEPVALVGHSIGEYVAATLADVMTLESAISIVQRRAELMQAMDLGGMVAIMKGADDVKQLIADFVGIEVTVINSRNITVVGGDLGSLEQLEAKLDALSIRFRRLKTSHAFHSAMMEPMLNEYQQHVATQKLSPPKIPLQSNVTGTWMTDEQATSPAYYASQVRSTVHFADNIASILNSEDPLVLLEMGAGSSLTQMAGAIAAEEFEDGEHVAIATMPAAKDAGSEQPKACSVFANRFALGELWASGTGVDWDKVESWSRRPRRIPLPGYVFDTKTFRRENSIDQANELSADQWFHLPAWTRHVDNFGAADSVVADGRWLVVVGDAADQEMVAKLQKSLPEARFEIVQASEQTDDFSSWQSIVESAWSESEPDNRATGVIHAVTFGDQEATGPQGFESNLASSGRGVTWLAKALGEFPWEDEIQLVVLTSGATNGELNDAAVAPANHSLIGTLSVVQKEYRAMTTRLLNIDSLAGLASCVERGELAKQLRCTTHHPMLAWHGRTWWRQRFEAVSLGSANSELQVGAEENEVAINESFGDGPIVVTGGLGELSLGILRNWAKQFEKKLPKLVLLGRNGLPPREQWKAASESQTDLKTAGRIQQILEIEAACGDVEIMVCDCSDKTQLSSTLDKIARQYSNIGLILHTAGVLRDGAIATKTADTFDRVYRAKSISANFLADWCLQNHDTRLVLFSSISAEMGLFGQVDYSGANNVLDGISAKLNANGRQCVAINWPAIADVGMATRTAGQISDQAALSRELAENSLYVSEAADALMKILRTDEIERVAIARTCFEDRRQSAIEDGRQSKLSGLSNTADVVADSQQPTKAMLQIWRSQFGNEELSISDDYFEMGGDSLMAVGLIAQIEQAFGKVVPISHLINAPTVAKLVRKLGLVEEASESTESGSDSVAVDSCFNANSAPGHVIQLRKGDPKLPPLVMVHGADGAVMFYREFAGLLETDRSIFAIESPLLSDPDLAIGNTVEQVAKNYVDDLIRLQPEGPYLLAGYSFGGVAVVAMAAELESRGKLVEKIIVYDIANPTKVEYRSALERLQIFWKKQETNTSTVRRALGLSKRVTQAVRDRATFEIENRIAAGKDSADLDSAFWRHKKARETHMTMEEKYVPVPIAAPLRIVIATDNSSKFEVDEFMGWSDIAADLKTYRISGTHLELFNQPFLGGMVEATQTFLK